MKITPEALHTTQNLVEFYGSEDTPIPVVEMLSTWDIMLQAIDTDGNVFTSIIDHITGEFITEVRSTNT